MGNCFSDEVEQALTYIYYDLRAGKGAEGFMLLQRASDAGDGGCVLYSGQVLLRKSVCMERS